MHIGKLAFSGALRGTCPLSDLSRPLGGGEGEGIRTHVPEKLSFVFTLQRQTFDYGCKVCPAAIGLTVTQVTTPTVAPGTVGRTSEMAGRSWAEKSGRVEKRKSKNVFYKNQKTVEGTCRTRHMQ